MKKVVIALMLWEVLALAMAAPVLAGGPAHPGPQGGGGGNGNGVGATGDIEMCNFYCSPFSFPVLV